MKKTLLMTGALLALTCGLAFAGPGGLSLAWLDCDGGGAGGAHNRVFACNTNTGGGHILVGSFVASSYLVRVTGFASVMDAQAATPGAQDWWQMRTGGCRGTAAMTSNFDFTGGPFTCLDYWQGGAIGGHQVNTPVGNRNRILATAALPAMDSRIGPIPEGTEVYCLKLTMNNSKTVGLGACAGCTTPVCIVLNQIFVTNEPGNPAGNKTITFPIANTATWQGGISGEECLAATPAKNSTWGQVKSLYR
jgi:hypothetical protein